MRRLAVLLLLAAGCEPGLSPTDTQQIAVAGGSFTMGSQSACTDELGASCAGDREPRSVTVSDFKMDATEVTRLQWAACVVAGRCREGAAAAFDSDHRNDPVLVDDPADARAYCAWKMGRLPTEAEFELAARGGTASALKAYPWGDAAPTCDQLPHAGCKGAVDGARPVGTNAFDVTASGIHDLAGSAPEWVDDGYTPYAGCLDRLSYGEICWGQPADCAASRCMADGATCAEGCLPPAADEGGAVALVTSAQAICPLANMSTAAVKDPVLREATSFGVVRGAGSSDRACDAAGYARRHATPRRYAAGFRCVAGAAPAAELTYRFAPSNCPSPTYAVSVSAVDDKGAPADFALDLFPPVGSGSGMRQMSMAGKVDDVPCQTVFVLHPIGTPTGLKVSIGDARACAMGTQAVDLTPGGDVPSVGLDDVRLSGGSSCLPQASCTDALKNGLETDVDCGGPSCPACATGKQCQLPSDCASHACQGGVCAASSCNDNVLDGDETDVDCGGSCPACPANAACKKDTDCTTSYCKAGRCAVPSCTDKVKDGKESDVDCGGGACPACMNGQSCGTDKDCASGHCVAGACNDVLTVVSESPMAGAVNVNMNANISITFNLMVAPGSVTATNFFVDGVTSGPVTESDDQLTVTIAPPTGGYAPNMTYTVHVLKAVTSTGGASLAMDFTFQFTTSNPL